MNRSTKIAIMGKGGAGKTTITVLLAKFLIEENHLPILLIDADPTTSHLARILGINMNIDQNKRKSIEYIRKYIINTAITGDKSEKNILANSLYDIISEIILHNEKYDLLVLGQPETIGCFCPSNSLLRELIENISEKYKFVLIDCEAGMEQIHREVVRNIDFLLIISEPTLAGLSTVQNIIQSAKKFTFSKQIKIIINKFSENIKNNLEYIFKKLRKDSNLENDIICYIPLSDSLYSFDNEEFNFTSFGIPLEIMNSVRKIYNSLIKI